MSKRATSQAVKQFLISLLRIVKLHTREMADRHYPRRRNYLAVRNTNNSYDMIPRVSLSQVCRYLGF